MTAPVMSAAAAAWIREHAWTGRMRKTYTECPGFYSACACQSGMSPHCQVGKCGKCGRGTPLRSYETLICGRGGNTPLYFPEPFTHETDVSATGPRFESLAMVWLADRVCRWICPCTCHTAPAPKAKPKPKPESVTVQDSLFEVAAC